MIPADADAETVPADVPPVPLPHSLVFALRELGFGGCWLACAYTQS